ncbi:MAG: tetratricopeptide repeat protein, partial [bacterium]|nr:tetratricopeptide repeat protein [bacterium]
NYPEAEESLKASLEVREKSLETARAEVIGRTAEVVEAARFLGQTLRLEGKYREAVDAYRKADALRPNDPVILNGLGLALSDNGEFPEAEGSFRQSLELYLARDRDNDHPDVLTARHNLAETLSAQGDLAGARQLQEQVLEARERLLGADHPDTLTARNNLAATLYAQGDLAGARQLQEQVLEARERLLGADHPDTLTARNNLAQSLYAQGDLAGARQLQEQVLEARERLLGAEDRESVAAGKSLDPAGRRLSKKTG